jgi:hypothetical protein
MGNPKIARIGASRRRFLVGGALVGASAAADLMDNSAAR